ncbi:hypothetical protein B566_EDAN018053 [Ephemera danica]|nr:hypothetical protein B566_EDAN018053 [Ephemera danica]
MEKKLQKIYYDLKHPASFGTVEKLWIATGKKYNKLGIQEWLRSQDPNTLHKERRVNFSRSRYYVPSMNNLFQCGLCDMRNLSNENEGNKFILTVIDVFCKKAWARILKTKSADEVICAFQSIFRERKPLFMQSDRGKEFTATKVQKFLKDEGIKFYTSNNPDKKCAVIERFNRTLKNKMYKYFTHASTLKYVDILQNLLVSYNNTKYSAINKTPNEVCKNNEREVYDYLYSGNGRYEKIKPKGRILYKVGDLVRITKDKCTFEKGYKPNWSREIFKVVRILSTYPTRYKLIDLNDEEIEGSFYAQELQRVATGQNTFYKISEILDTRGSGSSRKLFVSWEGYPSSFNSDKTGFNGTENHTGCFKVYLGHELLLPGEWEVGLAEIFFPMTIHNLTKEESICYVHCIDPITKLETDAKLLKTENQECGMLAVDEQYLFKKVKKQLIDLDIDVSRTTQNRIQLQ